MYQFSSYLGKSPLILTLFYTVKINAKVVQHGIYKKLDLMQVEKNDLHFRKNNELSLTSTVLYMWNNMVHRNSA